MIGAWSLQIYRKCTLQTSSLSHEGWPIPPVIASKEGTIQELASRSPRLYHQ